ncbi:hypothetical protein M0R45_031585 [Rubus argutus]|uniref:Uncharacterized protein n=1 Tax=Rubus argutus TaxID=59490 RepID=A0AAW1WEW6_RUBAR
MKAAVTFLLHFTFIFSIIQARSIISQPQALRSFKVNDTQNVGSYQISISFGDAYGYQVYAPRIDDPHSRTFESCSTYTFQISGPCTYQICYVYLYRSGYDGWKVDTVTIYGHYTRAATFYYNAFIPNNLWFGFDLCHGTSASSTSIM